MYYNQLVAKIINLATFYLELFSWLNNDLNVSLILTQTYCVALED